MESWRAASSQPLLFGVMSSDALPMVQLGFVEMWVQSSQGCPLEWAMAVAGGLDLPEVRSGCGSCPGRALMVWPVFSLLCVRAMALGLAATLAKCCGGGGVKLLGRCCPILDGVGRCDTWMKILHDFRRAAGDGTRGCHSAPWRRRRGVFVTSLTRLELWLSPGESLDSVGSTQWRRLRRRSFAVSIVFGDMAGPSSPPFGVRRCPS